MWRSAALLALLAGLAYSAIEPPRPGWNLFSSQQDVQLGKEAQSQIERKMPVIHNSAVSQYLISIGQRLARSRYAGNWPYTFGLVADKNVNAFSLPGGPIYVNSGTIAAADNEAQLAGVLAHEMSHIVLRHATNQASRQNLIQIPAMIAGAVAGGSLLGSLTQLGIGLGANSVLLKFSRTAEAQADYNGALIMADAGYNPLELAHFFEKLEATQGKSSTLSQFLSDHPNPGNRVKAIEDEIRQLPPRTYEVDSEQFERIKDLVKHLPDRGQLRSSFRDGHPIPPPDIRPSNKYREYRANDYTISYPDNWEAFGGPESAAVTFAPRDALFQTGDTVQIGYGAEISYYLPQSGSADLKRDTQAVIHQLQQQNSAMRVEAQHTTVVNGHPAIVATLSSQSPYPNEEEIDTLVTVERPEGLFYFIFIAPKSEFEAVHPVLEEMLRSIQFR